MPLNLLILPFLGGYLLVTQWRRYKWEVLRADPQTKVFYSALAGIALLGISVIIHSLLSLDPFLHRTISIARQSVLPFEYAGRALLALLLAPLAVWILNRHFADNDRTEQAREIMRKDDPFEVFIHKATTSGRLVMFSMKSGRTYVGLVRSSINPATKGDHVVIHLQLSGERRSLDGRFVPQVNYGTMLREIRMCLKASKDGLAIEPTAESTAKLAGYLNRINTAALARTFRQLGLEISSGPEVLSEQTAKQRGFTLEQWRARFLGMLVRERFNEVDEDFRISLPVAEIQSVRIFVPEIQTAYFPQ